MRSPTPLVTQSPCPSSWRPRPDDYTSMAKGVVIEADAKDASKKPDTKGMVIDADAKDATRKSDAA